MSIRALSFPTKRLAAAITSTGLVLKVSNVNHWDGNAITAGEVGTLIYAVLRNEANTQLEIVEVDASTVASGATTGMTITKRGLGYMGGTSANAETAYDWPANETLVDIGTHPPQLFENLVDLDEDQTVAGVKTFSSIPATTGGDASSANQLVRYSQLLAAALGSYVVTPVVVPGKAGEALAVDQLVYLKASDNRWWLCDADTAATVDNVVLGITRGSAAGSGSSITSGVTIFGEHVASSAIFVADTKYFASNTAGGFATSTGTTEVSLGLARTTTAILFAPRYDQRITEDIQDALAGSSGTPSGTNKFLTQADPLVASFYAATVVGTDAYAVTPTVPQTLQNGLTVRIKLDVANTGPATFNYNGGGALAIVKGVSTALVTGDLPANRIITLVYNSTGTVWQLVDTPNSLIDGSTITDQHFHKQTFGVAAVDNGGDQIQTIAHGLGVTPKRIRIRCMNGVGAANLSASDGIFDGSTYASIYMDIDGSNTDGTSTAAIATVQVDAGNATITATAAIDATNITLTWSATTATTASLIWEAEL